MKLKIFLLIAVAFIASSEAGQRVQDPKTLVKKPSPVCTQKRNSQTLADKIAEALKGGDSLKDILRKLVNGTYNYPNDVVTSCFKEQNENFENIMKKLIVLAEEAIKNIKAAFKGKELDAPLKNYVDVVKKIKDPLWTLLLQGNIEEAWKVDEGLPQEVATVKCQIMNIILLKSNCDVRTLMSQLDTVLFEKIKGSKDLAKNIMKCIKKKSSKTQ